MVLRRGVFEDPVQRLDEVHVRVEVEDAVVLGIRPQQQFIQHLHPRREGDFDPIRHDVWDGDDSRALGGEDVAFILGDVRGAHDEEGHVLVGVLGVVRGAQLVVEDARGEEVLVARDVGLVDVGEVVGGEEGREGVFGACGGHGGFGGGGDDAGGGDEGGDRAGQGVVVEEADDEEGEGRGDEAEEALIVDPLRDVLFGALDGGGELDVGGFREP